MENKSELIRKALSRLVAVCEADAATGAMKDKYVAYGYVAPFEVNKLVIEIEKIIH